MFIIQGKTMKYILAILLSIMCGCPATGDLPASEDSTRAECSDSFSFKNATELCAESTFFCTLNDVLFLKRGSNFVAIFRQNSQFHPVFCNKTGVKLR